MLRSVKDLENYSIGASDGEAGHVKDFYFDDDAWVIRYLVVDTGSWLSGRKVLLSPMSICRPNWPERTLAASISREQIRNSPDIDTAKPVSRQNETTFLGYYSYPNYWGGMGMWGGGMYPYATAPGDGGFRIDRLEREKQVEERLRIERTLHRNDDPHLRSSREVIGYHIHADDGEIGHVEDLLVDEQTWAVRYMVVDTSNWWLGHKVLISPEWITDVDWTERTVSLDLTCDSVKKAPPYDSAEELNRQRESGLYEHYGRSGYWPAAPARGNDAAHP